jgi:hypothetical protein
MIKYIQHDVSLQKHGSIVYRYGSNNYKCKYCGIDLFWDRKLSKYVPQFSVSCLTEDEYIIKSIIE